MGRVAFLGAGKIGAAMIENLLRRGESVVVWNRTIDKARALEPLGAKVATSAAEAVRGAERVHLVLFDDASVDAALDEIAPHVSPGTLVVDHTTTGPAPTIARFAKAAERGMQLLHAPLFAIPKSCREGQGLMVIAGPTALFEAARPALSTMASDLWHLGERADLAAAMKLFGNSMLFVMTAGLADVIAMARGTGIDARQALSIFSKVKVENVIGMRGEKMAARDYSTSFALETSRKDLQLMIDSAGAEPLVVLPALAARMDQAIAAGHGADDMASIIEVGK